MSEHKPSIAVVVLDTLRKDTFDAHFDWLPGRRFERAFSTANWTVPAHASLFTGRYASEVGVYARHLGLDTDAPALAERLRAAGYTTRAFSANINITPYFGFDRGFEQFRSPVAPDRKEGAEPFDWRGFRRETDTEGLRQVPAALRALRESDAPTLQSLTHGLRLVLAGDELAYGGAREARSFVRSCDFDGPELLFVNLMEAHEPYDAPEEYVPGEAPPPTRSIGDLSSGTVDAERVRRAYHGCAAYLSEEYRRLFDALGHFDYVITCSDHGELLGEYGAFGHEHGVYPELTNVPLCLSGPGLDGASEAGVSLLDVHATVLGLAGLDPEAEAHGQSLLERGGRSGDERPGILAEYLGLTRGAEGKLREWGHSDRVDVYDRPLRSCVVSDGTYGYETPDGFAVDAPGDGDTPKRSLRRRLDRLAREVVPRSDPTSAAVPDHVERRLRDLGYR